MCCLYLMPLALPFMIVGGIMSSINLMQSSRATLSNLKYFPKRQEIEFDSTSEYIRIQKYILMRDNAQNFLSSLISHSPGFIDVDEQNLESGNKITCHTLEKVNLQNDIFKILNKRSNRSFIYENELLYCFAFEQYPNVLTDKFDSDKEIIIPSKYLPQNRKFRNIIIGLIPYIVIGASILFLWLFWKYLTNWN